jgi:outer membrane protein assembly factor BamB
MMPFSQIMKSCGRTLTLGFLTIGMFAGDGVAADWPQWRGPDRTDVSAETGLLRAWPSEGPRLRWTFKAGGIGFSGPAVVGETLYIMGARGGAEQLLAIDVVEGKERWSLDVGDIFEIARGNGPRSTPTVVDGRVYALGAKGNLVCVDAAAGRLIWKTSMSDLGGTPPEWGYCESVLVDAGRVICTPGGPKGALAALDAATGKLVWQTREFTDPAQYASPIIFTWAGVRQYVQLTMKSLVGVQASDGKVLWKSDWRGQTAVVPTPIYRDGHVYITSGYGVGSKLVRLGPDHSVSDVYVNKVMKNQHGGVILIGDHLYGYSDGAGWTCQDFKTGEVVWSEKEKLGKGAIAYADERFYCLSEDKGIVALIEASAKGWKEHGRFQLPYDSTLRQPKWLVWTHPVISGGRLYLRNQELLFSYDVKAERERSVDEPNRRK